MCVKIPSNFKFNSDRGQYIFDILKGKAVVYPAAYSLPTTAQTFFDMCLVNRFRNFNLQITIQGGTTFTNVIFGVKSMNPTSIAPIGADIDLIAIPGVGTFQFSFGGDDPILATGLIFDKILPYIKNPDGNAGITIGSMYIIAQN